MKMFSSIFFKTLLVTSSTIMLMNEVAARDFLNQMNAEAESIALKGKKRKDKRAAASIVKSSDEPVVVDAPSEAAAVVVKKEEEAPAQVEVEPLGNYGKLTLAILPSYMTVEGIQIANNSAGELNSEMYPVLKLEYAHNYHNWVFGVSASIAKVKFQEADQHELIHPEQSLMDLDLYVGRSFGRFTLSAGVGQDNKIFYKAMNATIVEIERRTVQRVYLQPEVLVYKGEKNLVSVNARVGINPSADTETYDVTGGLLYTGSLKWDHKASENKMIGVEFYYNHDEYKTNKLDLTSSEVGLGLSFSYDWGSGI